MYDCDAISRFLILHTTGKLVENFIFEMYSQCFVLVCWVMRTKLMLTGCLQYDNYSDATLAKLLDLSLRL